LESHAEIGAVGWSAGWLDLSVENLGAPIVDNFPDRAMNKAASIKGYRTDVTYLGTGGLFIPRSVFEATGGFDVAYDPTSFEDTDLSFAVKRLGFEIAYRDLTCIRHDAHQTTTASKESPEYMELFNRNSKYFLNKWIDYRHYFIKY
jgi:GT2 family glycosyltransferase